MRKMEKSHHVGPTRQYVSHLRFFHPACSILAFRNVTIPVDGVNEVKVKVKLLQFHTDQRPAYYGTNRRRSRHITGRRPLNKDKVGEENFLFEAQQNVDFSN